MKKFLFVIFLLIMLAPSGFSQENRARELFDLHRNGEIDLLKGMVPVQLGKGEADSTLYIRYLLAEDGEKAAEFLEVLVDRYPRSEFAIAAYAGLYLFYLANDNFRKANNCVLVIDNEFPGESIRYFLDDTLSPEGEGVE